jgi:hypothetical protein
LNVKAVRCWNELLHLRREMQIRREMQPLRVTTGSRQVSEAICGGGVGSQRLDFFRKHGGI